MKHTGKTSFSSSSTWRSKCQGSSLPCACMSNCLYRVLWIRILLQKAHDSSWMVSLPPMVKFVQASCNSAQELEDECPEIEKALICIEQLGRAVSVDVYLSLLRKSAMMKSLALAKGVKASMDHHKVDLTAVLGESLVTALTNCHALDDAYKVFDSLQHRTTLAWTAMISGYRESGKAQKALTMYHVMRVEGALPDQYTLTRVLKACMDLSDIIEAQIIHDDAQKIGLASNVAVGSAMLSTYAKCGSIKKAEEMFNGLYGRSVITWNAMLSAYVDHSQGEKTLMLFRQLHEEGIAPNEQTILIAVQACGIVLDKHNVAASSEAKQIRTMLFDIGKALHCDAHRKGFDLDLCVCNALISMYGKCGGLAYANNIFEGLHNRDVVSWSAILSAYYEENQGGKALQLYRQMHEEGVSPDSHAFVISIRACGIALRKEAAAFAVDPFPRVSLEIIHALHSDAYDIYFLINSFVCNSLISMYSRCGSIKEAESLFTKSPHRDIVSWNAMLSACVEQGLGEKALLIHRQMVEEGLRLGTETFVLALQACNLLMQKEDPLGDDMKGTKVMPLDIGQALHADARRMGFASRKFVGNSLITMYGRCGSISGAESSFSELAHSDVVSWTALLSAYVEHNLAEKALLIFQQMQEEGFSPNEQTFVTAFQACVVLTETDEAMGVLELSAKQICRQIGRALHCDIQKKNFDSHPYVSNAIICMYGKFGCIMEADNVFARLLCRDAVSWNTLMLAYVDQGHTENALLLFRQMHEEGDCPDTQTLVVACQACSVLSGKKEMVGVIWPEVRTICLEIGRALHAEALQRGYDSDLCIGNILLSMYGKCGSIEDAENVFSHLSMCDVVSWTSLLSAYVEQGHGKNGLCLYRQMHVEGVAFNEQTLVTMLQASCSLIEEIPFDVEGKTIKEVVLEIGKALLIDANSKDLMTEIFFCNTLISLYGKCGSIEDAETLFNDLSQRNVVSWNAMLSAYVDQGQQEKALSLYRQMQEEEVSSDQMSFVIALQSCSMLGSKEELEDIGGHPKVEASLEIGKALHADAWKKGLKSDTFLAYNLVSMYTKCDNFDEAETVFDELLCKNFMLWNLMLFSYVEKLQGQTVLQLYVQMLREGYSVDEQSFALVLQAACILLRDDEESSKLLCLEIGKALHVDAMNKGFSSDVFVGNILIDMYGRVGEIVDAEKVFNELVERDANSCNKILSAYISHGEIEGALQIYTKLDNYRELIDDATLVFALQLATELGSVDLCRQLHFKIIYAGLDHSIQLANTLIRTYGSCASMVDAEAIFDGLTYPNIVSYNAAIAGLAQEGNYEVCSQMFKEFHLGGNTADEVTMLSFLTACSHSSVVNKGVEFFELMSINCGLSSTLKHYAVMVDLLGRMGDFNRLENFLLGMPMQANGGIWMCVLGVCRQHGQVTLAQHAFDVLVELKPTDASMYILMSNVCADAAQEQAYDLKAEVNAMN